MPGDIRRSEDVRAQHRMAWQVPETMNTVALVLRDIQAGVAFGLKAMDLQAEQPLRRLREEAKKMVDGGPPRPFWN